jgi:hypothetical protein
VINTDLRLDAAARRKDFATIPPAAGREAGQTAIGFEERRTPLSTRHRITAALACGWLLCGAPLLSQSTAAAAPIPPPQDAWVLHPGGNRSLCLGILPGDSQFGAKNDAVIWTCNGNADQHWRGGPCTSSSSCQLINGNDQCLSVHGASVARFARVSAGPCTAGAPDKYWVNSFDSSPDFIVNDHSDLLLTVPSTSLQKGLPVQQDLPDPAANTDAWTPALTS